MRDYGFLNPAPLLALTKHMQNYLLMDKTVINKKNFWRSKLGLDVRASNLASLAK